MSIGQFFLHSERWLYSGTGIGTGLSGSSGGILWELDSVRWVGWQLFPLQDQDIGGARLWLCRRRHRPIPTAPGFSVDLFLMPRLPISRG